ncbi:MAG: S53 family peptidase [Streptosporangiaceae bacterium]
MRVGGKAAIVVSAAALTGGLAGLAGLSGPAGAGPAAAAGAAAAQATVLIHPDVQHVGRASRQPPTTAACEAQFQVACYEPTQVQQAYNLPMLFAKGVTGKGATIVIVDSFGSPTIKNDLATFDGQFGIPAPPSFTILRPAGAVPPFDPTNGSMQSWAGETTLDVEYAHTIAPGASIVLVETPVAETEGVTGFPQIVRAEKFVINHHIGDVISQSFSATEQTFSAQASVDALRGAYVDAEQHHVTVLAASGDNGAANVGLDGSTFFTFSTTAWPPSDPLVTAVGGTQLHLDANGNHTSPDTVWNDTFSRPTQQFIFGNNGPNPLAAGGGKSVLFSRPSYQNPVRGVVGQARGVPDISMSAACNGAVDVYQSFPGISAGWYPTCGTSEATPLFAGIVALAVQQAHHSLGLINPALYLMSARHLPGLVDVTSGDNTVSFTQGRQHLTVQGFTAGPGYDLASGLGTVNAALFVPELAALAGR